MFKHICRIPKLICCLLILFLFSPSFLQAECISGDCSNGTGTQTWPDGTKYVGEWRDGKHHGIGTYTWPTGQKYVGEFRDGKFSGRGILTFPNGKKYVGEWRDDKPVEQKTTAGRLSQPGAATLSKEELKRSNEAFKQRYPETIEPATTKKPRNNEYILWIVFGAAFAVFIIFLIWKNKSNNQEGVHTTQQKQQVYTPNKPESSQSFICPDCDEKVQKGITKSPYCAENISDLETEDEQELIYRKIKPELHMIAIEENRKLGEKRKLKRFSDRLKISFHVKDIAYRGLSDNLSLNGLFIRTNHLFPTNILLDIIIHLPNDLTSHLKGRVVRTSNKTLRVMSGKAIGYAEKGMGVEIIEKDALYLHYIRSFISLDGKQLASNEQGGKYEKIEAELQKKCHLFDVVAVVIGEESKQANSKGKAWFEAKIKNNTDCVFMQPIVTFMTTKDTEQSQKDNKLPEIGTILMSSSDNLSHWKPGETIILDGEINPSLGDVPRYELNFFDYLTKIPEFTVDFPMNINDYVSTLWIGSPCLDEMDENITDIVLF